MEIDGIINFMTFINKLREVERVILMKGSDRFENDTEHSYQLAMTAWYIITTYKLPLNVEKALKYGLVHDLVEIHAGDVFFYDQMDPAVKAQKIQKEAEALEQIKKDFADFPELAEAIEGYETKHDEESKFIYALDKLISPINIYLDGGRIWHQNEISFEKLYNNKKPKVEVSPEIGKYFDQLAEKLKQDPSLFPKE